MPCGPQVSLLLRSSSEYYHHDINTFGITNHGINDEQNSVKIEVSAKLVLNFLVEAILAINYIIIITKDLGNIH